MSFITPLSHFTPKYRVLLTGYIRALARCTGITTRLIFFRVYCHDVVRAAHSTASAAVCARATSLIAARALPEHSAPEHYVQIAVLKVRL